MVKNFHLVFHPDKCDSFTIKYGISPFIDVNYEMIEYIKQSAVRKFKEILDENIKDYLKIEEGVNHKEIKINIFIEKGGN